MFKRSVKMLAMVLSSVMVAASSVPASAVPVAAASAAVSTSASSGAVLTAGAGIVTLSSNSSFTGSASADTFGTASAKSAKPAKKTIAQKKAAFLKDKRFRHGAPWPAYKRPILSPAIGTGCYAYAADFVKYVYGKNSPTSGKKFTSPKNIRGGDVIKVLNSQHWFVVIERNGNKWKTAEGNWGGKVYVSNGVYTINKKGKLCRNGKVFRTFAGGWHFE